MVFGIPVTPGAFNSDNPIILTASGPSLDAQISWLKDHHQDFTIVAAGSSVATLLRHDIHVDICVLLEMATTVFKDLNDLAMSGINLKISHVYPKQVHRLLMRLLKQ